MHNCKSFVHHQIFHITKMFIHEALKLINEEAPQIGVAAAEEKYMSYLIRSDELIESERAWGEHRVEAAIRYMFPPTTIFGRSIFTRNEIASIRMLTKLPPRI